MRNKAAELSEKHEDLRDTQDNLMLRIEAVLNSIQRRLPVASDSEIRMQRQLQGMERKMKDLVNGKIHTTLDISFLSNHNIHNSSSGLCFWASDPLIDGFY